MASTLSGLFKNCYGLDDFKLKPIEFGRVNRAIIYSPNGVMKTSFAKVFEDISKGQPTTDRFFRDLPSTYDVALGPTAYSHAVLKKVDEIYVINSFDESFECQSTSITLLIADTQARQRYDKIYGEFGALIGRFEANLVKSSGISKAKMQGQIVSDFQLSTTSNWIDIIDKLKQSLAQFTDNEIFSSFKYVDVFNSNTQKLFDDPSFLAHIDEYVARLNDLIRDNALLSSEFNDTNAEELGASLEKNDLFKAHHVILLKDKKTEIKDVKGWTTLVKAELDKLYASPELAPTRQALRGQLNKNVESKRLLAIISKNPGIIRLLTDLSKLKTTIWLHLALSSEEPFAPLHDKLAQYREELDKIRKEASREKEPWKNVLDEFNRRFRVPFTMTVSNQEDAILRDRAPTVSFQYKSCKDTAVCTKENLMNWLSMGERRALYLLYVLFDVERIKSLASQDTTKEYLVIADDVADSFDYKNKYAIVEYLHDICSIPNIDLLLLTHNFDFYRTAVSRLNIYDENCFIVQRDETDGLKMHEFGGPEDYFKRIVQTIRNGKIASNENKKTCLVASIPFYRNLADYMDMASIREYLTCLLHWKSGNPSTGSITVDQLWAQLKNGFKVHDLTIDSPNQLVVDLIAQLADSICGQSNDETCLENKIVLSMAIRLATERYLEPILLEHNEVTDCGKDQTRKWAGKAHQYLSADINKKISEVCLMTPEEIHMNAFMYEPIIDMSDWALKDLYQRVKLLVNGANPI